MRAPIRIVGGGVVGAAVAYILCNYTNARRVAIHEGKPSWGMVASSSTSNSQTLHCGGIENYERDVALKMQWASGLVSAYVRTRSGIAKRNREMLLGVGPAEAGIVRARHAWVKNAYSGAKLLDRAALRKIEPKTVEGRDPDEEIVALCSDGYAVDFGALAASFVKGAVATGKLETVVGTPVRNIVRDGSDYALLDERGSHPASQIVIAAGTRTLLFAHRLDVAKDHFILPVFGGFFYTPSVLRGKVYTVQPEGLPFAAVHGDPDLAAPGKTRFGPTAIALPVLDTRCATRRERSASMHDFLEQFGDSFPQRVHALWQVFGLLSDPVLRSFLRRNVAYTGPWKRRAFLPNVRKIVPTMRIGDLEVARDSRGARIGGIRPQLVNRTTGKLVMGVARFEGENAVYAVTPSPGASSCLAEACSIARSLASMDPKLVFDEARFFADHGSAPWRERSGRASRRRRTKKQLRA
jgi:malate dehydrogenase (quinone)